MLTILSTSLRAADKVVPSEKTAFVNMSLCRARRANRTKP